MIELSMHHPDRRLAERYLLGQLEAATQASFEQRYLGDESVFECVQAVESELIDAYCADRLDPELRARFEGHYLAAPRRRARAKLVKALAAEAALRCPGSAGGRPETAAFPSTGSVAQMVKPAPASRSPAPVRPMRRWLPLAAAAMLGMLAIGLTPRLQPDADPTRTQLSTLSLELGRTRGIAEQATIRLPRAAALQLQLKLPQPLLAAYSAILQTPDGRDLWHADGVAATQRNHAAVLRLTLPRGTVGSGDYVLVLSADGAAGADRGIGEYFFRVGDATP